MAANVDAIYGLSPVIGQVTVNTANASRDGTGAMGLLKMGAANGSRIDYIIVKAVVSTNPNLIRIYIEDGAANIFLRDEIPISSVGASPIARSSRRILSCFFTLPSGYRLWASTVLGETFRCFAHGADY